MAYKRQDRTKELSFNLNVDHILELRRHRTITVPRAILSSHGLTSQNTQQFSADRLDNSVGHIRDNIRLTTRSNSLTKPCGCTPKLDKRTRRTLLTERSSRYASRDSVPPATILQYTRPVKVANTNPRRELLFFQANSAAWNSGGRLLFQCFGLRSFLPFSGSFLHSWP